MNRIKKVISKDSPLLSEKIWTAAIVQHERTWISDERKIFEDMRFKEPDAVWNAAHYFRVMRTISRDETFRARLRRLIYAARVKGANRRARLDSFAKIVEKIACDVGLHQPKHGRPISAVSKMLVQLHPNDGFIYDKNARLTINKISKNTAINDALKAYWLFVQAYSDLFCALRARVGELLEEQGIKLQPTRIIDKFLWLQGEKKPNVKIKWLIKRAKKKHKKVASEIVKWYRNSSA
jgi:hypothetical protein